ncbi:hypothetical protein JNUCC0626_20195 [Lentzea sp. JNUCC 0626]|uniref:hypothetical protein n=1 Tax=Lentzea sp. JNUCC 0626 TaxID=3367513 RepID=UPI0037488675
MATQLLGFCPTPRDRLDVLAVLASDPDRAFGVDTDLTLALGHVMERGVLWQIASELLEQGLADASSEVWIGLKLTISHRGLVTAWDGLHVADKQGIRSRARPIPPPHVSETVTFKRIEG